MRRHCFGLSTGYVNLNVNVIVNGFFELPFTFTFT